MLRQEYEKRNRKQTKGVIIEFIYLKHKKQSKQHLSEDDDPVVRTENIQCETCIQQLGINDQTIKTT